MVKLSDFLLRAIPSLDPSAGRILVTDGNGVIGYRVALKLLAAGFPVVRVGLPSESPSKSPFEQHGAEVVSFDFDDPETYSSALEGVKTVYLAVPHHDNWQENFEKFIAAIKKAGVKHVVKLSVCHSLVSRADTMQGFAKANLKEDPFLKVPLVLMHREIDSKFMKLPMNYTLLFASHFMSNPTVYHGENIRKDRCFYGASGDHAVNYVSPNDVADVAVHALVAPLNFKRQGLTLTGPESIKDERIAEILSNKLDTKVEYKNRAVEEFADQAKDTHWGPAVDVAFLEYVKASGIEEDPSFITKTIERVCGRPAETYEDYLGNTGSMTAREVSFLEK